MSSGSWWTILLPKESRLISCRHLQVTIEHLALEVDPKKPSIIHIYVLIVHTKRMHHSYTRACAQLFHRYRLVQEVRRVLVRVVSGADPVWIYQERVWTLPENSVEKVRRLEAEEVQARVE